MSRMMQAHIAELLFSYIRDIIYAPQNAQLDLDTIPEEWRKLAQGLIYLGDCIREQHEFGKALSMGELHHSLPSVENVIAAPLKAVHGMLLHLTWQTQQVAKGDYGQRVDYMGDFSAAFNSMVEQLEARRTALLSEQMVIKKKNMELEQTQTLLISLSLDDTRWIVALDAQSGATVFESQSATELREKEPDLAKIIYASLMDCSCTAENTPITWECSALLEKDGQVETFYYSIASHYIPWKDCYVIANTISDVTQQRQAEIELTRMAYSDPLTGVYNRRYGITHMEKLVADGKHFAVAFIDIDYLKLCNDQFGHQEGNQYIITVAGILSSVPEASVICRVGGDEFMLVLQLTEENQLNQILYEKREILLAQSRQYRRSFSYGICVFDGSQTLSQTLETADRRMYAFKIEHKAQRQDTPQQMIAP